MGADPLTVLAAWLATWAIHGSVVLGAVLLVGRLPRVPERVEEGLLRFALVAGLCTASLQVATGGAVLEAVRLPGGEGPPAVATDAASGGHRALPSRGAAGTLPPRGTAPAAPAPGEAMGEPDPGAPTAGAGLVVRDGTGLAGSPLALPEPGAADDGVARGGAVAGLGMAGLIGVAGLVLAALGLARLGVRRLELRRLLATRRPLVAGCAFDLALRDLAEKAGLRRRVRLSVSDEIDSPVAFGVLRPEICVPRRALRALDARPRDAMLAHELAHVVRSDPLWLELVHTLAALFPWQPLLGLAARRLRTLAEFRCDALGARLTAPVDVADCLVEVAGWLAERRRPAALEGLAGMSVQRAGLRARVERLLAAGEPDAGRPLRAGVRLAAGVSALAILSAALPGAGVGTVAADDASRGVPAAVAPVVAPPPAPAATEAEPTRSAPARSPAGEARAAPAPGAPAAAMPEREPAAAPADDEVAMLRELVAVVGVEHRELVREVDALRADVAARAPDPTLATLLATLDRRLAELDARRRSLTALVEAHARSLAAGEPRGEPAPAASRDRRAPSDDDTTRARREAGAPPPPTFPRTRELPRPMETVR